jgi:hypothetical protein
MVTYALVALAACIAWTTPAAAGAIAVTATADVDRRL